jgi:hypothetical protein
MKIYFNAFWGGFLERTDPVHVGFFLELFTRVFDKPCESGSLEESDILCESMFGESALTKKKWSTTLYYLGESNKKAKIDTSRYSAVLWGERNHANIVNCPHFLSFLHSANKLDAPGRKVTQVPANSVVAIITNPTGEIRNSLLNAIEAAGIQIIYAGSYKNNIGYKIPGVYGDEGFLKFVSQFKFVIAMENTGEDTYITEKICTGFLAGSIPIYWGSPRITDYFNKDRIIVIDPANPGEAIQEIKDLDANPAKWLSMVNQPVYTGGSLSRSLDDISRDCKAVLHLSKSYPLISQANVSAVSLMRNYK